MSEIYETSAFHKQIVRYAAYRTYHDGTVAMDASGSANRTKLDRALTGAKNPQWRNQVKRHVQAGTSLSAYRKSWDYADCNYREIFHHTVKPGKVLQYNDPGERYYHGDQYSSVPTASSFGSSLITKADNQAKTDYIGKANDARQVLQSGELIGEFAELVRQVSHPGQSLRRGLSAYVDSIRNAVTRRRVRSLPRDRRVREQSKIISDTWLEYQFGWRPLISEIDGVIDYVKETDPSQRLDTRSIQGVGIAEDSAWISSTWSQKTMSTPGCGARIRKTSKVLVIYRGQVGMSPNMGGYVAEKVGFAPDQWLPTLWELVPYSFLLDYFANIGDMIYALSFPSSSLRWTMKTIVEENTAKFVDVKPIWTTSNQTYETSRSYVYVDRATYKPGGASNTYKTVERSQYTGSFIPTLEFSIPTSGTKWLNLAALFAGSRYVQKLLS